MVPELFLALDRRGLAPHEPAETGEHGDRSALALAPRADPPGAGRFDVRDRPRRDSSRRGSVNQARRGNLDRDSWFRVFWFVDPRHNPDRERLNALGGARGHELLSRGSRARKTLFGCARRTSPTAS